MNGISERDWELRRMGLAPKGVPPMDCGGRGQIGDMTPQEMSDAVDDVHEEQSRVARFGQCSGGCRDSKVKMRIAFPIHREARREYGGGMRPMELCCRQTLLPCPMLTLGPIIKRYQNINSGD